jgi:hypothetical protein
MAEAIVASSIPGGNPWFATVSEAVENVALAKATAKETEIRQLASSVGLFLEAIGRKLKVWGHSETSHPQVSVAETPSYTQAQ